MTPVGFAHDSRVIKTTGGRKSRYAKIGQADCRVSAHCRLAERLRREFEPAPETGRVLLFHLSLATRYRWLSRFPCALRRELCEARIQLSSNSGPGATEGPGTRRRMRGPVLLGAGRLAFTGRAQPFPAKARLLTTRSEPRKPRTAATGRVGVDWSASKDATRPGIEAGSRKGLRGPASFFDRRISPWRTRRNAEELPHPGKPISVRAAKIKGTVPFS